MVVWGGFHYNNRLAGEELLSLLEQGVCSVYRCFIVINFFPAQKFCYLVTKHTYHWTVYLRRFLLLDKNSYTHLLSGQFHFFAKVTGALLTRVTVVPTQPIKTLNLSRSERTVYAVSNSWMETKQAVLPLSAPVSTSILLCFGNRHNHITVFDETIFVSSMTLYQQAVQTYIHLLILRCKTLVGECPKPL